MPKSSPDTNLGLGKTYIQQPPWSPEEDAALLELKHKYGNNWKKITEELCDAFLTLTPRSADACRVRIKRIDYLEEKQKVAGMKRLSGIEKLAMCKPWR